MRIRSHTLLLAASCLLATALAFSALPWQTASAQTSSKTFNPIADAYVTQSSPDANFETSTHLRVDSSPITRSYLRFAVSGLNGAAVKSARLRVFANSSNSTGYSVNAEANSSWTEKGITYKNAPAPGSHIATSPAVAAGKWTEVDVSSYIKGEGTYNLVLTTNSDTNTSLASRRAGADAPQLVLTLAQAAAQTFTFTPSADAFVIQTSPDTNNGSSAALRVDGTPATRSYLRFHVSGLNGSSTQSVKLRIYANSSNDKGFSVYAESNDTWTENGITYKNAPAPGSLIATSKAVSAGQWNVIDISKAVINDGSINLVLSINSPTNTSLASRETGSHAPQLIVMTGAEAGPTAIPTQAGRTSTRTPVSVTRTPSNTPVGPTLTPSNTAATSTPTRTPVSASPTPTNTPISATSTPTRTPVSTSPTPQAGLTKVNLTKGPDLIYTGSNTSMKIFWQWTANSSFRVDWGTSASYGQSSPALSASDATNHLYSYAITGLTPGTKYFYRVVVGTQFSDGTFFAAPAASATTLKFASYGDTRSNPSTDDSVAAKVVALYQSDPAYQTLNPMEGDAVSNGDTDAIWTSEFFSPSFTHIRAMLANLAVIPIMGNHEGTGALFQRYFPFPYVAARYWSFDYGPVHFTYIDQYSSYASGSAQYNWVKADLAASTKKWKIVVMHEPGWSANGGHPNNTTMQTAYEPLFEQNKVALVLAGHNHYYARAMVNGIPELTVGTGGAPLYSPASGQPNIVKTFAGSGFEKIEISGSTLMGTFVSTSGAVQDTFSVTR